MYMGLSTLMGQKGVSPKLIPISWEISAQNHLKLHCVVELIPMR